MSKLMHVLGIILLAAGVALAIMGFVNQAQLQVRGIEMASAINLIIGGILAIGLGGVIGAVGSAAEVADYAEESAAAAAPAAKAESKASEDKPAETSQSMRFPSFSKKLQDAGVEKVEASKAAEPMTPAVRETIDALEQAKSDLENALTGSDVAESSTTAEAPAADGELYVTEEKVIRGRQARLLSDGTVEAETDEGWMRFENLEHLDEYLEAMSPTH